MATRHGVTSTALVLGLAAGAWAGPARAYTMKSTDSGATVHWTIDAIRIAIDPRLLDEVPAGLEAILSAASAWNGVPETPRLTFAGTAAPGDVSESFDVYVRWVAPRDWPAEREQLAVTVATFASESGAMVSAEVLINGGQRFVVMGAEADVRHAGGHGRTFDLASVLTHELGHVLGLDETADDEAATMWPALRAETTHQRTLADDDVAGVTAVYSDVELTRTGTAACSVSGTSAPRAGGVLPALALATACARLAARIRSRARC
jgi:hypothetical protein